MKRFVRSVLAVAALAVMLGGLLGQAGGTVAAAGTERAAAIVSPPGPAHRLEVAPDPGMTWGRSIREGSSIKLNPDPDTPTGALIEVSVTEQKLTAWQDGDIVYRFPISTARPGYHTPRGHYAILDKWKNFWSRQWQVWMPLALRFHGSYFLHSLPYKPGGGLIGGSRLGHADSHGCVRVGPANARKLFAWTEVGTPVWIH